MQNDKLLDFLKVIIGPYKEYAKSEYYFVCPLCLRQDNKKKLAINLNEKNKEKYMHWHCWRDDTHSGESIYSLLKKMRANQEDFYKLQEILGHKRFDINLDDVSDMFADPTAEKPEYVSLPPEFKNFTSGPKNSPEYRNALSYLVQRNISAYDILKNNIGYCDRGHYAGYVIFPSYDENGALNYFVARSYYNSTMRYKNPLVSKNIVFNELHISWSSPIVLVEGVFDALAIRKNAIPLLGKTINDSLRLKVQHNDVRDIYICLDKDALKNSVRAIDEFMRNGINVYFVPLTEKDPSDIGFVEITEMIRNAKKMDFEDLIRMKLSL